MIPLTPTLTRERSKNNLEGQPLSRRTWKSFSNMELHEVLFPVNQE